MQYTATCLVAATTHPLVALALPLHGANLCAQSSLIAHTKYLTLAPFCNEACLLNTLIR